MFAVTYFCLDEYCLALKSDVETFANMSESRFAYSVSQRQLQCFCVFFFCVFVFRSAHKSVFRL